jgi:hypothetical protein
MKKLSLLGIVVGAALLTAAPVSIQPTSLKATRPSPHKHPGPRA